VIKIDSINIYIFLLTMIQETIPEWRNPHIMSTLKFHRAVAATYNRVNIPVLDKFVDTYQGNLTYWFQSLLERKPYQPVRIRLFYRIFYTPKQFLRYQHEMARKEYVRERSETQLIMDNHFLEYKANDSTMFWYIIIAEFLWICICVFAIWYYL
jgi:hypothetical protein